MADHGSQTTTESSEWEDELGAHIAEGQKNPRYRAAFEDAEMLHKILDTLVGLRHHWGLSQTAVAHRMGVKQPTVSQFENEGGDPRISTLQRYARAVEARLQLGVEMPASCDWIASDSKVSYRGVSPASGSVQVTGSGLTRSWRVDGSSRNVGWELAG